MTRQRSFISSSQFFGIAIAAIAIFIQSPQLQAQEVKQIDITADLIEFDSDLGTDAKRLLGNVNFKHEDVNMTCDSAWYFSEEKIVQAYSNVHVWQGDTLNLYGDYLKYSGDTKMANIRNNVILLDNENRLTTEYLDHDFGRNLAYYLDGGTIINGNNTLESLQGNYFTKEKLFFFKDSVVIINPDYTMYSDTLKYNTVTEISYFLGPTDIVSEENYIYCENGWYDTQNNISQFNKNAFLVHEGRTLAGDSLYYERENGIGKAYYNVKLTDTVQQIVLTGNEALYYEAKEFAMLTDSALMIQIEEEDSLFVHADTLLSVADTIPEKRLLKAFYKVKFYRPDIQGMCDSMVYSDVDSVFRMFGKPVIWSEENQITAAHIELHTREQKPYKLEMIDEAFIVSQEDSSRFNQIRGRNMTGFILNNKLRQIDVDGNSQTIYYAKDGDLTIGANKAESSNLKIFFDDGAIRKIVFVPNTDGTFYPLEKFTAAGTKLEGFKWLNQHRPLKYSDVYIWE